MGSLGIGFVPASRSRCAKWSTLLNEINVPE